MSYHPDSVEADSHMVHHFSKLRNPRRIIKFQACNSLHASLRLISTATGRSVQSQWYLNENRVPVFECASNVCVKIIGKQHFYQQANDLDTSYVKSGLTEY